VTSNFGSWLRVVAAPAGATRGLGLGFIVEGVQASPLLPLDVVNVDVPTLDPLPPATTQCAFLRIVDSPKRALVSGTSLQSSYTPFDGSFTVVAYNALGQPVRTPDVSMYLYDSAGVHVYATETQTGSISAMSQVYQNYLARAGGGLAFPLGNSTAAAFGVLLHAPIAVNNTDGNGAARFTQARIVAAQNTFARCVS
jgi:hypothetical protein